MSTALKMPAVTPSMTEGNLVRWLKAPGEPFKAGEALFEVEGDKAVVEVEAERDGVLARIVVPAGTERVAVDTVIAELAGAGASTPAAVAAPPSATAASRAAMPPTPLPPIAPSRSRAAAPAAPPRRDDEPRARVFASPSARRVARELDVDLALVQGSGPHGRILGADVEAAARSRPTAAKPAVAGTAAYDDLPLSNVRRVIAQRLAEAKRTIPHFYLTIDCEVDALLAARRQANELLPDCRLSVNDFVIKAAALALLRVPDVNVAWTENAIRRFRDVDVAVAVSTPQGLITPIVRGADRKSVRAISTEMRDLADRARGAGLKPAEFQGGGFTISNLGMAGVREFSAIINPPQACILAVGAAEPRPVVRDGALAVATLMTCTLSVDHRAVDGVLGAKFLAEFKRLVEAPFVLAAAG